jgi:hypothetical protein
VDQQHGGGFFDDCKIPLSEYEINQQLLLRHNLGRNLHFESNHTKNTDIIHIIQLQISHFLGNTLWSFNLAVRVAKYVQVPSDASILNDPSTSPSCHRPPTRRTPHKHGQALPRKAAQRRSWGIPQWLC